MHLKNPIGQIVKRDGDRDWHVVGVIKDFVFEPAAHCQGHFYRVSPNWHISRFITQQRFSGYD